MTSADAVRYHMLARSPNSQLDFDVDQVVQTVQRESGLLHSKRLCALRRHLPRSGGTRLFSDDGADLSLLWREDELRNSSGKALELGNVIEQAVVQLMSRTKSRSSPTSSLPGTFHPIYDRVRVLHSEVPPDVAKARLRFYRAAAVVFYRLLRLNGHVRP